MVVPGHLRWNILVARDAESICTRVDSTFESLCKPTRNDVIVGNQVKIYRIIVIVKEYYKAYDILDRTITIVPERKAIMIPPVLYDVRKIPAEIVSSHSICNSSTHVIENWYFIVLALLREEWFNRSNRFRQDGQVSGGDSKIEILTSLNVADAIPTTLLLLLTRITK